MNQSYVEKKLAACRAHLDLRGVPYEAPLLKETGADEALFSFPLRGELEEFEIAFLETGMTALRQIDQDDDSRMVLIEQAIPEFIVDIASDLKAGYACSHLQHH